MKPRYFSIPLLLCLIAIILLASCSQLEDYSPEETAQAKTEQTGENETALKEDSEEEKVLLVSDPLTWEKINAIPVANDTMTESELRQICVDYFRLQLSYQWTPSESFRYTIESYDRSVDIKKDQLYIGSPYDSGQGNLYKIMNHYDPETGILSVSTNGEQTTNYIGNHCTSSSHWGWSRVSNSFRFTLTRSVTEANGAIKVGSYKYENAEKYHTSTREVCNANGEQVMFQSYGVMKPADGVVCFNGEGHVMMISQAPVIQYLSNGTIDGDNSYVLVLEQVSSWEDVDIDNATFSMQGRVDKKYTFRELFKKSYLPFTVKELIGQDPVEKGTAILVSESTENLSVKELSNAKITSNYEISDITVKVTDENGDLSYSYIANCDWVTYEKNLSTAVFPATLSSFVKKGGHKIEIQCRIGTGELLAVYSGELTK